VLDDHDGNVDYHNSESDEVHVPYHSDHQVFMSDGRCKESHEESEFFRELPSSHGIIDMTHEETMNGKIPFSPVLRKISSVPPVVVEPSICEVCELPKEVHIGVEEGVEPHEPEVSCRYTHVESLNKDFQIFSLPEWLNCINYDWIHVLIDEITIGL